MSGPGSRFPARPAGGSVLGSCLAQLDRQAGGGALHAGHPLDAVGDAVAQLVQVFRLELDDDVVGAGDGIDGEDARVWVAEDVYRFADTLRLAHLRLDKDVASDSHSSFLLAAARGGEAIVPPGLAAFKGNLVAPGAWRISTPA